MLQAANRLAKTRDFNLLFKRGFWVKGNAVSLRILNLKENRLFFPKKENPNIFENQLKLAFSVGLRISKKAVERNKIKRQLREAARLLLRGDAVRSGYYIMVVPNPSIKQKNYAEISEEMKILFEKAGIFKS